MLTALLALSEGRGLPPAELDALARQRARRSSTRPSWAGSSIHPSRTPPALRDVRGAGLGPRTRSPRTATPCSTGPASERRATGAAIAAVAAPVRRAARRRGAPGAGCYTPPRMAPPRWFLPCMPLSGAAALVYEVAWTRLLTLYLGHGVAAASTVLAAFMGGLAVGAARGRPAQRPARAARRAMRLYAAARDRPSRCSRWRCRSALAASNRCSRRAYADGSRRRGLPAAASDRRACSSWRCRRWPWARRFPSWRAGTCPPPAPPRAMPGRSTPPTPSGAAIGALATGFVLLPALGLRGTTGWAWR